MTDHQLISHSNKSIAVLPFVNMSADPENEYFSDGITEEIINALTSIKGLKVIARTSSFAFKNKHVDVRTIGNQLGVSTVLEGSVRRSKNRIRITAQLVSTIDGTHIWSKSFDRDLEDIFALQDEVSLLIADQIRENFGHFNIQDHLIDVPTENIEAYNLYLKGRYHQLKWNAEDLLKGVAYYEQSIALDPGFALPYFGAALSYGINASWGFISYQEGIAAADRLIKEGLKLNDKDHLAYFAKATISLWGMWDFKSGYKFLSKAIELNPSFTDTKEGLAELYTAIGEFEKALECTNEIINLNPLSPNHYYTKGNVHYLSGDYHKTIVNLERALQMDAQFALAIETIALCYILLNDSPKLDEFLMNNSRAEEPDKCRALFKLVNPDAKLDLNLEDIRTLAGEGLSPSLIAWDLYLQVHLGNHDMAMDILEKGVAQCTGQFINFKNDPFLAPLHESKRFRDLISRVFDSSRMPVFEESRIEDESNLRSLLSENEVEHFLSSISLLLGDERLFLDPNLSLKSLAEMIELHPNKLSWLINERIGKNFNEYINDFRLAAFKEKALDPANSHVTLLGLAYDSGFNTKSVFNAYFKKKEGTTPREWLKQHNS